VTESLPPEASSEALEPLGPSARVALMVGPVAGLLLILLVTWLFAGAGAAGFVASMALGTFLGGGKLIILAGTVEQAPVGHWGLAALVVYLDVAVAVFVMGALHQLYHAPAAGPKLAAAREAGWRFLQRHPGAYKATWISLAGFVAVPFNGTGALVGALLGRMLGLSRPAVLTATASGSIAGAVALALAGGYWAERINAVAAHPLLGVAAVLFLAALAILGSKWMFGERTGG